MGFHNRAIDQIKAVARFRCQSIENPLPDTAPRPTIEAIVSRCVRPIPFGQISPRHPRAQHVKYRVHNPTIVGARALSSFRHQRLQKSPFLIAQIKSHDPPPLTVNHDYCDFSRNYLSTDPNSDTAGKYEKKHCIIISHFLSLGGLRLLAAFIPVGFPSFISE